MEDQLDQLVDAGVNPRMVQMVSDQPTVEEILETLLELKKAVYYCWWERRIEAALNGEDVSGWTLRQGLDQWVQARHNSSSPASDDEDGSGLGAKRRLVQARHNCSSPTSDDDAGSGPGAKRRRVQAGHNSSGPPE